MKHPTLTKKRMEKRHQQHPQDAKLHEDLKKGSQSNFVVRVLQNAMFIKKNRNK